MQKFKVFLSMAILIATFFLLFNRLFTSQPIQITLESGQEITTTTSDFFSLSEALLMVACAFLIGSTSIYLFYNSEQIKIIRQPKKDSFLETVLPLLKPDEKKVVKELSDNGGEMQQNKLCAKLGLNKVKTTRILYGLEQKMLIKKERHGLTNMIKLEKK